TYVYLGQREVKSFRTVNGLYQSSAACARDGVGRCAADRFGLHRNREARTRTETQVEFGARRRPKRLVRLVIASFGRTGADCVDHQTDDGTRGSGRQTATE